MPAEQLQSAPAHPAVALAGADTADGQDAPGGNVEKEAKKEIPNLFAVRNWEPPRPMNETKPAPPPPPQAPPLPFRYLGKVSDPERGMAFMLSYGDRVLSVKAGDVIDNLYKVEGFENGQLYFLYQPMNIRQSLFVGNDS